MNSKPLSAVGRVSTHILEQYSKQGLTRDIYELDTGEAQFFSNCEKIDDFMPADVVLGRLEQGQRSFFFPSNFSRYSDRQYKIDGRSCDRESSIYLRMSSSLTVDGGFDLVDN